MGYVSGELGAGVIIHVQLLLWVGLVDCSEIFIVV